MSNVIAVVNQKGGVAKTTSVYNIGYSLAIAGKRVLLIDFDSQASLTVAVGMELDETEENNIGNVLLNTVALENVALSIMDDVALDIIPSNNNIATLFAEAEFELADIIREFTRIIDIARQIYDYILIDCPPTVANMFIAALAVCDSVVAPVTSGDYLSYVSLQNALRDLYDIQAERGEERPAFLGVILSRYKKNIANHIELLKRIRSEYRVLGCVAETDAFMTAIGRGLPVKLVKPATKQSREAAKEYEKIADFVMQFCEYNGTGKAKKQKKK